MKKCICVLLVVLLFFTSCDSINHIGDEISFESQTNETTTVMKTPFDSIELEPDRTDLPDYSVLQKLSVGMTFTEAQSIAGNPQRMESHMVSYSPETSSAMSIPCYIYDSSNGPSVLVCYVWHSRYDLSTSALFIEYVQPLSSEQSVVNP